MHDCLENPIIFVNGAPHKPPARLLSGFELKHLAGIALDFQLFQLSPTLRQDRPVGDMEVLEMKDGLDFYGLPIGLLPEGWNTWDGRAHDSEPGGGDGPRAAKP
jgi:hypothetical protein